MNPTLVFTSLLPQNKATQPYVLNLLQYVGFLLSWAFNPTVIPLYISSQLFFSFLTVATLNPPNTQK